jgi:hypothetical protein
MARRVFFSFHFDRDNWRVAQVRNSWVVRPGDSAQPFLDKAEWEAIERQGKAAIRTWIDNQMKGTSVTAVLIGQETAGREWVEYEIKKTVEDGKGLLGIYIHGLKDRNQSTDWKGSNPFERMYVKVGSSQQPLSNFYPTYDWVADKGYENLPRWIDAAAQAAGL